MSCSARSRVQELRILLLGQPQRLLRLHHQVGVEQPLDLARPHLAVVGPGRRSAGLRRRILRRRRRAKERAIAARAEHVA